jgi:hypothetical protein
MPRKMNITAGTVRKIANRSAGALALPRRDSAKKAEEKMTPRTPKSRYMKTKLGTPMVDRLVRVRMLFTLPS